jgi:hypothetical protein
MLPAVEKSPYIRRYRYQGIQFDILKVVTTSGNRCLLSMNPRPKGNECYESNDRLQKKVEERGISQGRNVFGYAVVGQREDSLNVWKRQAMTGPASSDSSFSRVVHVLHHSEVIN